MAKNVDVEAKVNIKHATRSSVQPHWNFYILSHDKFGQCDVSKEHNLERFDP